MFGSLKSKVGETDTAKKLYESEEFDRLKEIRSNYKEFKSTLKDGLDESQNPIVQGVTSVTDYAYAESSCAKAIKAMEAYDPYFVFEELEQEAIEIFAEFYCNYLTGNLEYLETVSGGVALAKCKAEIESRVKDGWKYKY